MKAIVYSLFHKPNQALDFASYFRGFMLCLRFNRLIYPEWRTILETDKSTYEAYDKLFEGLQSDKIEIHINKDGAKLCEAMLWRLKPAFETEAGKWKYSHVLCRDVDSPSSYREAQAVQYWINRDKAVHAITDSESHILPLMGGLIGVRPDYFAERTGCHSFEELMNACKIDLSSKGSDQTFLNDFVYPRFAQQGNDSITQHYFEGCPNTFLSDFKTCLCGRTVPHKDDCHNNIEIGLPAELKESISCVGHCGSAGWYQTATERFLRKHRTKFDDIVSAEENYPEIFYWTKDKSLG